MYNNQSQSNSKVQNDIKLSQNQSIKQNQILYNTQLTTKPQQLNRKIQNNQNKNKIYYSNKVFQSLKKNQLQEFLQEKQQKIMNLNKFKKPHQQTQGYKILTFIGCTLIIYFFQIIYGVIEQRIYKVPYNKIGKNSESQLYTDALTPMLFSAFFSSIIGYVRMNQQELQNQIPIKKLLKLSLIQVTIHFCLITALMNASYILVVMANSCGLLSVILIGVFLPKGMLKNTGNNGTYQANRIDSIPENDIQQDDKSDRIQLNNMRSMNNQNNKKIGPQKIFICFIICFGIFIFNYFASPNKMRQKGVQQNDSTTKSISLLTFGLLSLAILLQGLRPQFQQQIKRQYSPSPICFYYNFNKVLFIVLLIISVISFKLIDTIIFITTHDQLFLHLILLSMLNSICAMFIFKIITLFRQHIYPLVSTVRKCITVGVSILYFGHHISILQVLGIIIVFSGVLLQIAFNYKLLQKNNIKLPFFKNTQQSQQRYVKNNKKFEKNSTNNHIPARKFQVYKNLNNQNDNYQFDDDIQGI